MTYGLPVLKDCHSLPVFSLTLIPILVHSLWLAPHSECSYPFALYVIYFIFMAPAVNLLAANLSLVNGSI